MQNELITCNYNTVNQLLNSTNPDKNFKYDADGNMTKGYTPEGYVFTAAYDAENRLQRLQYTDNSSVEHKREYIYREDSLLAQIKRYENYTLVDDTRIVRDGFLPVQERDANNNTLREYAWGLDMGGGIGGLLNLKQSGQNYAYLYDGKGNVTSVLDKSQAMVASYRYDAFGKFMSKTGALNQPFMFSTKRYDAGTGLSYYGYRFYSPAIARWLTRDPIGEAGGINLYGFVSNDPVNYIDPDGQIALAAAAAAAVAAAAMTGTAGTISTVGKLWQSIGHPPPPPNACLEICFQCVKGKWWCLKPISCTMCILCLFFGM